MVRDRADVAEINNAAVEPRNERRVSELLEFWCIAAADHIRKWNFLKFRCHLSHQITQLVGNEDRTYLFRATSFPTKPRPLIRPTSRNPL